MFFFIKTVAIFFIIIVPGLSEASMGGTVSEKNIKFSKGVSKVTLKGIADYAHSYVYNFYAKKGQKASIDVSSKGEVVRFSFFESVCNEEPAFKATKWQGLLACGGLHKIVVVMNEQEMKAVPFEVTLQIGAY